MTNTEPQGRYLALKALMMPRDTNPNGTIFGGVLLSHIDQSGMIGAQNHLGLLGLKVHPLVTVAMDRVEFLHPVFVGDVLSFHTHVANVGRTSVRVHVTVETERNEIVLPVTEADVTYVAVKGEGANRRPVRLWPNERTRGSSDAK